MVRKKDDIHDYCTAHDAAQILSLKLGRPIRPDYISKMGLRRNQPIRRVRIGDRWMYLREDIEAASIRAKQIALATS